MALKGKFDKAWFERKAAEAIEVRRREVIETLMFIGNECVAEAKGKGSYTDRTGNLRNSVGYVIFDDGEVVHQYFDKTASGTERGEDDPLAIGRGLAEKVGSGQNGMVLVVVAGMKYAVYVEARGYNVLTSAELLANAELPRILNDLGLK